MSVAIYAGSFDPVTNGHVDLIRRGAALFDEVVVAMGQNPAKKYWFDEAERLSFLREACQGLQNVRVVRFEGLLVEAAKRERADVILRGLRAMSDFEPEFRYGLANRDLSGIETLFLVADPRHIFVSSSLVREIAHNGGNVSAYVPEVVDRAIAARRGTP